MKRIKIQRLRWLGHDARMDSSNPVRKVFESEPGGGCRRQGRSLQHWAKQVDENLRTVGIRNWRQAATARDVWRRKLAEAGSTIISPSKSVLVDALHSSEYVLGLTRCSGVSAKIIIIFLRCLKTTSTH